MAFAFDEAWIYGGQLSSSRRNVVPEGLGKGDDKVTHSLYIQGPSQFGTNTSYSGNKGGVEATVMIAQNGTSVPTTKSLYIKGDTKIEGDGQESNAVHISGPTTDVVYIDGDVFVTGAVDCGNKGKLASRFAAADGKPKPFDIKHPSKDGWRLRYACIEGPEVGVYHRGRVRNEKIIKLPYYWKDLVDVESISVQLQPIGAHQDVIVKRWDAETIYLQANGGLPINCFYHVYAERKDINPLITEYEGDSWKDYPDPNFNPETAPDPNNMNYNDPEYRGRRNTITI